MTSLSVATTYMSDLIHIIYMKMRVQMYDTLLGYVYFIFVSLHPNIAVIFNFVIVTIYCEIITSHDISCV